ncbi:hypothetical protein C2S52_003707 [Perilla frutescens var. hirtella]|nr:hypothetical protein C2S52_003707 [Perilla frutescens var. hirtella]
MCSRIYCIFFLVLFVVLLSLGGVSSRHLPQHRAFATNTNGIQGSVEMKEGKYKKIGSRPPSCEHKCYGCMPCEAIQVPTTTSHFGILYTNYEPEGWKCKCGPTFYTP